MASGTRERLLEYHMRNEASYNLSLLRRNPYPGRGIIMGLSEDGSMVVQIYWITGRRDTSRNRVIVKENGTFRTDVFDKNKSDEDENFENYIYNAIRDFDGAHVVTNGNHTDTVISFLEKDRSFENALATRDYEEDPLSTPRISGLVRLDKSPKFLFSVIRSDIQGNSIRRFFDRSHDVKPGTGFCVHTYDGEGENFGSFKRDPYVVPLRGGVLKIAETYWNVLDKDNRVAIVVKGVDLKTGDISHRIINKHGGSGATVYSK